MQCLNILVAAPLQDDPAPIVKIADFGMAQVNYGMPYINDGSTEK